MGSSGKTASSGPSKRFTGKMQKGVFLAFYISEPVVCMGWPKKIWVGP